MMGVGLSALFVGTPPSTIEEICILQPKTFTDRPEGTTAEPLGESRGLSTKSDAKDEKIQDQFSDTPKSQQTDLQLEAIRKVISAEMERAFFFPVIMVMLIVSISFRFARRNARATSFHGQRRRIGQGVSRQIVLHLRVTIELNDDETISINDSEVEISNPNPSQHSYIPVVDAEIIPAREPVAEAV